MTQSRRDFLRTSALLGAGGMVLGDPFRILRLPQDRKLGFALVGLGNLSTNQIAPALQKTKYCRLAGIVTGHPAKADAWRAKYNIPDNAIYNYDTMSQLRNNPDIDVVYVVTPNALHAEHTNKAFAAGKHVLCEKPMEVSVAQCQSMIDAGRKAGKKLAIGYRCQFDPQHLASIAMAHERTLGAVKQIDASFGFPAGDPAQWRLNHALSGGGPLMDVGIYALQTSRMIAGREPVRVRAVELPKTDPQKFSTVEEAMTFDVEFSDGLVAHCATSYKTGMNQFAITTERGTFGMQPAYNYSGNRMSRSDNVTVPMFPPYDVFANEMDDFAQRIMTNTPSKVPGEEGLRDVRILMAIYEAAHTGRAVNV